MTSTNERRSSTSPEDSVDTRQRILVAAAAEFKQKGFAGARVDEIARLARCNKNLLYYYFNDKAGLYAESLKKMVERSHARLDPAGVAAKKPLDWLRRQAQTEADADWRRLWLWEAIDGVTDDITLREERLTVLRTYVEGLSEAQKNGGIRADLDPGLLGLALLALAHFPQIFPQLTWLVTGLMPDDPEFQRRQDEFFVQLASFIAAAERD